MKKVLCIISNILMSLFYIETSWMVSAAALFYLVGVGWDFSEPFQIACMVALGIVALTPVFCIVGIVLSVKQRKRENYFASFIAQFLPFGTFVLAAAVVLVFVYVGNFIEYFLP